MAPDHLPEWRGVSGAPHGAGTAAQDALGPFLWCLGAQCEAAVVGGASGRRERGKPDRGCRALEGGTTGPDRAPTMDALGQTADEGVWSGCVPLPLCDGRV